MKTPQIEFWSGDFGREYTDRNSYTPESWDQFYIRNYGVTKLQMNADAMGDLPKDARILEVGCNIGLQLLGLQRMGFTNLYGVELQHYAVEKAKSITSGIQIIYERVYPYINEQESGNEDSVFVLEKRG